MQRAIKEAKTTLEWSGKAEDTAEDTSSDKGDWQWDWKGPQEGGFKEEPSKGKGKGKGKAKKTSQYGVNQITGIFTDPPKRQQSKEWYDV